MLAETTTPTTRRKTTSTPRYRRIVFTLNNYTDEEYQTLLNWQPTWLVLGREKGAEGTPHIQGAALLGQQMTLPQLKKVPGLARAHIETMYGTPEQSLAYCTKEDTAPYVYGDLPRPGKRSDVADAVTAVQGGATMEALASTQGVAVVKFYKGLTTLRSLLSPRRDSPPDVYWLYGKTGTGKTRCAFLYAERLQPNSVWFSNGSLQWFDGYDGQATAILDDFRPKGVKFDWLLRLLDRYPMQVPFKGGFVNWSPRCIIFTSPLSVLDTFEARNKHLPEDIAQLQRRVTREYELPDDATAFLDLLGSTDPLEGEGSLLESA